MTQTQLPLVAITMGDPGGIGPEVIVKAFASPDMFKHCRPFVIGDRLTMQRAVGTLGAALSILPVEDSETRHIPCSSSMIPLLSMGNLSEADIDYGRPSPAACKATVAFIERALEIALSGKADAICTCPVNKAQLHANGFPFPGHTEFIRFMAGAGDVVMMLAGPKLRVALATIHEPLAKVPALLTKERLRGTIRITAQALRKDFGIVSPRIAVAGLNPHAGEAGKFGREELEIIQPVVGEFADSSHFRISGPWPADTLFYRAFSGEFDAVVAMYHDQGLIPVKLAHFNDAVNVSLGLPIVRTSVDHGTAYDIAGSGKADPGSLMAAIRLASFIAENRLRYRAESEST
ncbi:MAG: 4-hydroxythreonine-4-phosphate dehydrogenase PdxA [Syntrophobacter sp.]